MSKKDVPYVRPDFFVDYKKITFTVTKEAYVEFAKKLLDAGLTMKTVMREFVNRVADDDPQVKKMFKDISQRAFKKKLERYRNMNRETVDKLDHDVLYHLIEENNEQDDDDPKDD